MATYDLKSVICTVGATPISGYGETDAIGLEWDSDIRAIRKNADGGVVYSDNNDTSMTVTITLSQHARSYLLLKGLLDASGIGPLTVPLPFYLLDPSTMETYTGAWVFITRPAASTNKTAGDVVFKGHLAKCIHSPPTANAI